MASANDIRANLHLKALLSRNNIDLRRVQFQTVRGVAQIKGVLRLTKGTQSARRVGAQFLEDLEKQIRMLPDVKDVEADLRYWHKRGQKWYRDDGGPGERRRGTRVPLQIPLHWRAQGVRAEASKGFHHTKTLNISARGLCFQCGFCTAKTGAQTDGRSTSCKLHEFHARNRHAGPLPVTITLPNGDQVEADIKVLHVNDLPRSGDESVGARFHNLPKQARETLSTFIKEYQAAHT